MVLNGEIESAEMGGGILDKAWCCCKVFQHASNICDPGDDFTGSGGHGPLMCIFSAWHLAEKYWNPAILSIETTNIRRFVGCAQMQHGPDWTLISGVADGTLPQKMEML